MKLSPHFDSEEFACQCGCGYGNEDDDVSEVLITLLEGMREEMGGRPISINSGCRCESHNTKVGGHKFSQHRYGKAADPRALWAGERFHLVAAAIKMGCTRIGIGKNFIHVDVCTESPQGVIWTY